MALDVDEDEGDQEEMESVGRRCTQQVPVKTDPLPKMETTLNTTGGVPPTAT